jgi:hypothetical protein
MAPRTELKELSLWDEDYIAALPRGEFDWLEYKASQKFTDSGWVDDMSKYVSAWANYEGGYIIFGVKDPRTGSPLIIDGGVPESFKSKLSDWLDEVIPRLVEPPIQKLASWLVRPKNQASLIKAGHVLIVVYIPESEGAPHQATDHKYYQRVGRKLQPLKHRAIFDIAGRRRFPKLRTTILIHTGGSGGSAIFWKLENDLGAGLALYWKVIIQFPTAINGRSVDISDDGVTIGETKRGKSFLELRIPQRMGSPLFPGSDVSRSFKIDPCDYTPPLQPPIEEIRVTTFADSMPPLEETFRLSDVLKRH